MNTIGTDAGRYWKGSDQARDDLRFLLLYSEALQRFPDIVRLPDADIDSFKEQLRARERAEESIRNAFSLVFAFSEVGSIFLALLLVTHFASSQVSHISLLLAGWHNRELSQRIVTLVFLLSLTYLAAPFWMRMVLDTLPFRIKYGIRYSLRGLYTRSIIRSMQVSGYLTIGMGAILYVIVVHKPFAVAIFAIYYWISLPLFLLPLMLFIATTLPSLFFRSKLTSIGSIEAAALSMLILLMLVDQVSTLSSLTSSRKKVIVKQLEVVSFRLRGIVNSKDNPADAWADHQMALAAFCFLRLISWVLPSAGQHFVQSSARIGSLSKYPPHWKPTQLT